MKRTAARDVDEYLAGVSNEARAALEKLRKTIKAAAPKAVEVISYQIPAYKYRGKRLVYFAAFTHHCSLYPASMAVIEEFKVELKPFYAQKGTIRFTADKPLPAALVRKIVKARIAEIEAKAAH